MSQCRSSLVYFCVEFYVSGQLLVTVSTETLVLEMCLFGLRKCLRLIQEFQMCVLLGIRELWLPFVGGARVQNDSLVGHSRVPLWSVGGGDVDASWCVPGPSLLCAKFNQPRVSSHHLTYSGIWIV